MARSTAVLGIVHDPDSPSPPLMRRVTARLTASVSAYAVLLRTMWSAHRGWTVLAMTTAVASGLLPNVMIVASGFLVGSLPGAVRHGLGSADGGHALWALAWFGIASLGNSAVVAVFRLSIHQLSARYVPYVEDLLAQATLAPDRIDHLEDPAVAARISAASEASRENIQLETVNSFLNIVQLRTSGIAAACLLLSFHWWAPLVVLGGAMVLNRTYAGWQNASLSDLLTVTGTGRRRAEYLRGLAMEPAPAKELRLFGLAGWAVGRYADAWTSAMRPVWGARRRMTWRPVLGCAGLLAANAVLIGVLAYQAVHGTVSVGVITVVVQALAAASIYLGGPTFDSWFAARGARTVQETVRLHAELRPLAPVSQETVGQPAPSQLPALSPGPAAVSLRDVRFCYPGRSAPVLDGLNLDIPAGQSVAIVGENGAGKSTVIKLLCGFYIPGSGTVAIDGLATDTADLDRLRRRIAVIFQDFVRYELTMRENVGFGSLPLLDDHAALRRAMTSAGGAALAERTGWETVLSAAHEGGTDLSGGQWQRVALARALAALEGGAGLLILDEPTAALDVRAEVELFDRFLQVTRGATTILVSHRLSSVRHADRIVVLAGGRIVEDGTHDELIARGGRYATMFALQAQRFDDRRPGDERGGHDA